MPGAISNFPPELIQLVVDSTNGAWPMVHEWDHAYLVISNTSLTVNKHEVANIALVCRYWARIVRHHLFQDVVIRTVDEADKLVSFLNYPHSEGLSIAPLICTLVLEQKIDDPPWVHHSLPLQAALLNCKTFKVEVQARQPAKTDTLAPGLEQLDSRPPHRPLRSILPQFPRALPPSLLAFSPSSAFQITNATFRHPGDLNAVIRSTRLRASKPNSASSSEPVSPCSWEFKGCSLIDPWSTAAIRPVFFRGDDATFTFAECPHPWTFLRALFPTRRSTRQFERATKVWSPFVTPNTIQIMEKLFDTVLSLCTASDVPEGEGIASPNHGKTCKIAMSTKFFVQGCFLATVKDWCWHSSDLKPWCSHTGLSGFDVLIGPTGTLGGVGVIISDTSLVTTPSPWTTLDDILAELGSTSSGLAIKRDGRLNTELRKKPRLVTIIAHVETSMPRLTQMRKLRFWEYDYENTKEYVRITAKDVPGDGAQRTT